MTASASLLQKVLIAIYKWWPKGLNIKQKLWKNFIQILFFYGLEKHDFIVAAVNSNWRWEAAGSFETLIMNHLQDYTVMDQMTQSTSWLSQKSRKNSGLRLKRQSGYVISCDSSTYHSDIQTCTFLSLLIHLHFCEIIHSLQPSD